MRNPPSQPYKEGQAETPVRQVASAIQFCLFAANLVSRRCRAVAAAPDPRRARGTYTSYDAESFRRDHDATFFLLSPPQHAMKEVHR